MENENLPEDSYALRNEPDTRNKLQKSAMTALYDVLTYIDMKEEINVEAIVTGLTGKSYADSDYFIKAIVVNAIKNLSDEIAALNAKMVKWTFERRNRVEQAILLEAYTHFYYVDPKVDKGVVIDVAVKLAKAYLEPNDYKFVNAVLDKALIR